ncbi:hypothetical protein QEH52_05055 [Coraliomargarita sp. SDUM461003]|uniref:Uncharacterized protein n=1 Tax=Thalassobacterium maritimum TaxID=3041265 RepID=A0ABU1ARU8_9BACT|nr:hypothetical protein [Coraliomargarita sp. SDUM461003]MBT64583.1 hypothetical protein [Puniceicoccaceae bacterium]MDQ8206865.1 hypothetical protein [Coraliomargarita sp. SDUM461003]HBR93614.1 hypothetical protein [Opitutae bacterium]|tara:strand:- start:5338 stop:5577 length:240 start_codon:yes stop_codon:yes gene_type:complete
MEFLQEAIASRNIVVWVILVVLLLLIIKLLKAAGKGLVMLLIGLAVVFILAKLFPNLMSPMVDFIQGGWLGTSAEDQTW